LLIVALNSAYHFMVNIGAKITGTWHQTIAAINNAWADCAAQPKK
jgi:hypothetical protein